MAGSTSRTRMISLGLAWSAISWAIVPAIADARGTAQPSSEECRGGYWAAEALPLYIYPNVESPEIGAAGKRREFPEGKTTEIAAPDKQWKIVSQDESVAIRGRGKQALLAGLLINKPLIEALWSGDSRTVAINESDGGVVGSWAPHIFSIGAEGAVPRPDLVAAVSAEARSLPRCFDAEIPNLGVSGWLKNGREVLMVAEVPPHSSCRNMGAITGYVVSVESGTIVKRLSESQLRRTLRGKLGCRFRNGN
jgi:hypothetical protein